MTQPILAALALASLFATSAAQAQPSARLCLSNAEAEALTLALLPELMTQAAKTCAGALPGSAFLIRPPAAFSAKYRTEAARVLASATSGFKKLAGPEAAQLLDTEAGAALLPVMLPIVAQGIAKDVKAKDCPIIDRLLSSLEPLPPANMAKLMVTFFEMGSGDRARSGRQAPFTICPAAR